MENKIIMATKFNDVAHLYLGCEFKVLKTGEVAPFQFYYKGGDEPIGTHELCKADYSFDEVKPILRPLSDMTEEEAEKAHLIYKDEEIHFVGEANKIAFLLHRGFDLFGLIENGEAIDKTKF